MVIRWICGDSLWSVVNRKGFKSSIASSTCTAFVLWVKVWPQFLLEFDQIHHSASSLWILQLLRTFFLSKLKCTLCKYYHQLLSEFGFRLPVGGLTLWLPKILLKRFSLCWNGTLPLLALFLWMIWFNFSSEGDRKPSCTEKPTEPAKTSLECSERVWAPKSRCCDYCDCCVLCQGTGHQRSRHNMNVMWCVWGEPGVGNHSSHRSLSGNV